MSGQTVAVPPRPRGELSPERLRAIQEAQAAHERSQQAVEAAVLAAIADGASTRSIQQATGIALTTIQRYVNRRRNGNV